MVAKALLVRFEAQSGKDGEVEEFLRSAVPLVDAEPATRAWFAIRFGRLEYGIFDVFEDDAGRTAHLDGPVGTALKERGAELFAGEPEIVPVDVLADKLPESGAPEVTKGLLLTWPPRSGHEDEVAEFLRGARSIVADEPATIAWFALSLPDGSFGIFDVFPDNSGRFAHLTGKVPLEIAKHATSLLGGVPDMDMLNVLAAKLGR
jgi:quinol monooxygenase YgiN